MASQPIYQFYAELLDYEPKIWRRFQVPGNITLSRLGYIVMTLYEMKGSHPFLMILPDQFNDSVFRNAVGTDNVDKSKKETVVYALRRGGLLDSMNDGRKDVVKDMAAAKMKDLFYGVAEEKLLMEYDFGDSWQVELTLESVTKDPDLPGKELPRVLEGKGFGIVEDCGGTPGLTEVAQAFKDKNSEAYYDYRQQLGVKNLNLERLDKKDMNVRLKKLPRIFQSLYENGEPMSQASVDFLERAYKRKKKPGPRYVWVYTGKDK